LQESSISRVSARIKCLHSGCQQVAKPWKRKRDETRKELEDGCNSAYVHDWSGEKTERKENSVIQRQADASSDEVEEEKTIYTIIKKDELIISTILYYYNKSG
jgi:hypothetical protein